MIRLTQPTALAFATLLLAASCGGAKDEKAAAENGANPPTTTTAAPAAQKAVPVGVTSVTPQTFTSYLEVQGRVEFDENATIGAMAAGTITSIRVQRGDRVSKGQVIATIDAAILDAAIAELRTRLELTQTVFDKQKRLWDQQIGTEIQYLTAKNNLDALKNSLATQQRQRELYTVKAPFAGVVDEVYPKLGEGAAPGVPMVRLVSATGAKVLADVSESYASKLSAGNKALVKVAGLNADQEVGATVRVVGQLINAGSRTFQVELKLADTKMAQALRPNMIAVVRIQDYQKQGATAVPVDVVQRDEKNTFVLVAEDGKAVKRIVQTGANYGGQMEILGGLKTGDQLITSGYQALSEGQAVAPNNTPS
jgi:membrane fusion protein, multidrug efflux system